MKSTRRRKSTKRRAGCPVIWLITARDQLEDAFSQAGELREMNQEEQSRFLRQKTRSLNTILRRTFPTAGAITVLERLGGYAPKPDRHVLRIEVLSTSLDGEDRASAHVVKIGSCPKICNEVVGRHVCDRPANERGRVLLGVSLGACPRGREDCTSPCRDAPEDAMGAVLYQDAYHTLRAARVVNLENAFLNCVRWGTPSPLSLLAVIEQIFHELHNVCYQRSPAVLLESERQLRPLKDRLQDGLTQWQDPTSRAGGTRILARRHLHPDGMPFVDLLDFYKRAMSCKRYWPEVRFGRSHGDLHGRNVVVGLVDSEARWPAVFDFEDMSIRGFVAWDFVKLETELKIRAFPILYPGSLQDLVRPAYRFELELNEATESKDQQSFASWRDDDACDDTPEARLRGLLLGIRRRAKRYLQVLGPARVHRWAHEYYFFLACYGVYVGWFPNYSDSDLLLAYLGASCAATRCAWGVEQTHLSLEHGQARAQQQIEIAQLRNRLSSSGPVALPPPTAPAPPSAPPRTTPMPTETRWDVELERLKKLARSRSEETVADGIAGLARLGELVPSAPEVAQETAFALLELADLTGDPRLQIQALEKLMEFEERQRGLYSQDVECLCRWGRLWKDCGDRALAVGPPKATSLAAAARGPTRRALSRKGPAPPAGATPAQLEAADWYRMAATYYRRAYEASGDYYPGINLATLEFLIQSLESPSGVGGGRAPFRILADQIKQSLKTGASAASSDDAHWRLASLGEACLLLEQDEAVRHYRTAWKHPKTDEHARDAIRKQVERILSRQKPSALAARLRKVLT